MKLGFTGVYIIFLISAKNIDCGYPLEPPHGGLRVPTIYVLCRNMKNIRIFYLKILFFGGKMFSTVYLNRLVLIMGKYFHSHLKSASYLFKTEF